MRFLSNPAIIKKLSDGTVTGDMTFNLVSNVFDIRTIVGFSIQAKYTGAPVGTLSLQATNDAPNSPLGAQEWVEIAGSSVAVSASGTYLYNLDLAFFGWIRLAWVFTSGTGTLTAKIVTKGV